MSNLYFLCCFSFFDRDQRAKPVIIDPALYSVNKSDVFWVTEKRSVPTAYKLFTGEKLGFDASHFDSIYILLFSSFQLK
jgi:hypothetical protein